jgi:DNA repair exonuclease SbcCD ATPase subunit
MFKFHGYSGPCPKPPLPKDDVAGDAYEQIKSLTEENEQLRIKLAKATGEICEHGKDNNSVCSQCYEDAEFADIEYSDQSDEIEQLRAISKVCTGCGHDNTPVEKPALACCPDSRYRTAAELLKECNELREEVINVTHRLGMELAETKGDLRLLKANEQRYIEALEELACLGNGDRPGNSIGNCIAQQALAQSPQQVGNNGEVS